MVITPHLLAGAAIGAHSPNVWAAFCFGFISHYLLDSLPHWEYLNNLKLTRLIYFVKIFIDFIIAMIIVSFIAWPLKLMIIFGIIGALLPDIIEFLHQSCKIKIFRPLSLFHKKMHYYKRVSLFKGLISQIIIVIISVIMLYWG